MVLFFSSSKAWDVCAGIVIVQEAGGIAVGSKQSALSTLSSSSNFAKVTPDILQGRKYLIVRDIGDYKGESGKDAQKRIVKTFYDTIEEWNAV